ncbi:hypothetical protein [Priestia megaterium]|uniref:hypothetical protein n=1 Tax=Priestia megaterium TaxID=1404 RepID=UPI00077D8158|nr:hypothetical protein [Priestia megaterium]
MSFVKKKIILMLTAFTLAFSSLGLVSIASAEETENPEDATFENEDFDQVETVLSAIENIPDEVVEQGEEQTVQWLREQTRMNLVLEDGIIKLATQKPEITPFFSTSGCIGAVGMALLTTGFPAAKILKVKKAIKALGGTSKFVQAFYKSYKLYRSYGNSKSTAVKRAVNSIGSGLKADIRDALLDFFGISNIIANCT